MLSASDADQLFAQCERELSRSKILIDDCLAKSGCLDVTATGASGNLPKGVASTTPSFLLRTSTHLRAWRQSLALQDVLSRILEVVQQQHAVSIQTTLGAALKKGARRWMAVMTQFLASLRQTLGGIINTAAPSSGGPEEMLPSDTRQMLVLVTRYVWASVMLFVSAGSTSISERGDVPVLAWIVETQRLHTCFIRGATSHSPELLLVDGSVSRQILDDVLDVLATPMLQVREAHGNRESAVDVDANFGGIDPDRLAAYPVGGYPSLVQLVAIYAPMEIRTKWLVRDGCVDMCAARIRQLFLEDGDASRAACASAARNLMFVAQSCAQYAASPSSSSEHRRLLERFCRHDLWDAFLGACESSCFGRATVLASRNGLSLFVYHRLYVPLFSAEWDDNAASAMNAAGEDAAAREATMLTARYRLLRLVGDLAESELGAGGVTGAATEVSATASGNVSSAHQEVQRKRYQALLASTNGVMTMPILQQLAHDKGILLEETAARSHSGHVVFRMFTAGSLDDDERQGGGRLRRRRGGEDSQQQQWVFIEKGNVYVKRRSGSSDDGYQLATSLDDLLSIFNGA